MLPSTLPRLPTKLPHIFFHAKEGEDLRQEAHLNPQGWGSVERKAGKREKSKERGMEARKEKGKGRKREEGSEGRRDAKEGGKESKENAEREVRR